MRHPLTEAEPHHHSADHPFCLDEERARRAGAFDRHRSLVHVVPRESGGSDARCAMSEEKCSVDTVRRRPDGEAGALGRWRSVDLRRDCYCSRARDAVGFFAFTPAEHEAADRRLAGHRLMRTKGRPSRSCCRRSGQRSICSSREGVMVANSGDEVDSSFSEPVREAAAYASSCIQSARRSPIMMQVRLMFARGMVGMIEASTTRRFSTPRSRQCWSTTAIGSPAGPIRAVPLG